jgi:hypothetical protein
LPPTLNLQVTLPNVDFAQRPQPSNAVYVSTTGSDTNGNGTVGRPYQTIQKAIDQLANRPADQRSIRVRPGTYRAAAVNRSIAETKIAGSPTNPCWLLADPGVLLIAPPNQSPGESNVFVRNRPFLAVRHDYWVVSGFEFDGGGTHWNAATVTGCNHVVFQDLVIHDFTGNNAISLYNVQDIAVLGGKIYTSHRKHSAPPVICG